MGRFGTDSGAMDTLVLGCTHYPFVETELRRHIGNQVTLLEGGAPVARQTRRLLAAKDQLAHPTPGAPGSGHCTFFTTGNATLLANAIHRWLQVEAPVTALEIL